jgi:two-component system NtrC family sensor kinase
MAVSPQRLISFLKLLLVASVAAPALLLAFFAWHSYATAVQTAHDRADRFSTIVREHALKVFETISLTLESVDHRLKTATWAEIRTSKALWDELRDLQERSEQVGAIFVTAADGKTALTTRVFPVPAMDFSDRDYFVEQKERSRGLYIGRAYVGKISAAPIFNFSIRKSSAAGDFDGIIGISAFVSYFQDYYRSVGIASDDFAVTLLREDGQVLVRYPSTSTPLEIPPDSEMIKQVTRGERGTFTGLWPIDGIERIFGYAKVPTYPVYAIYSIDRSAIASRWLKGIAPGALLALLAALSLFSTCWFALISAEQQRRSLYALDDSNRKLESEMHRRERAEASLMQTQRLEAIGQLTGGIAHDFNNLLMVISGNLDLAERRWNDTNALKRKFKSIRYATDRAKALTQQLLGFARRHARDATTVDLNDAVEKASTLIMYSLPQSVTLSFDLAEEPCPVKLDVSELEAAILNVVGNARDAMPTGGTLRISTRVTSDSGAKTAPTTFPVELRIKDSGQGMSPETLHRVYEPFFTTKDAGKGTGLGLSQVYGFVQQSGGCIDIQSELNQGTCVTIRFPKSVDRAVEVESGRTPIQQENALTILVVEGEREVRQVSTAMLEDLGHQVLVARNSPEALALLHAGYPIDVLFTDVTLSEGVSGLELAERAVRTFSALGVLLTTGHPGRADLLRQNEFAILEKPYSRDSLAAALQAVRLSSSRLACALIVHKV